MMTPEVEGKLRKFKRLALSYADFKHAKRVSDYILAADMHEFQEHQDDMLHEALNCSMVVAYCRPFSGNSRSAPDLPSNLLRCLNTEEREVHKIVLNDRHKVLAHSDSDWLDVEPVVWNVAEHKVVVVLKGWGLAPLTKEITVILNSAAEKLRNAVVEERRRLEPELTPFMRVADSDNPFAWRV